MKKQIDLKHHVEVTLLPGLALLYKDCIDGFKVEIVKSGNGVPIPEDEPLILFRGRDRLAIGMLEHYRVLCIEDGCNDFQLGQVDERIARFRVFAVTSPTMKQPGITRGA